jgi:hypothetical protein
MKMISSKSELVEMARNYYRSNMKALKLVDTLDQSYRLNDVLRWCFRSPFPARSLNHALRSHNSKQLDFYSFLLNDIPRAIKQQHKRNAATQLYKGMKLSSDLVDNLDKYAGELVCTSGFFTCTTSRTAAWTLASSPSRRPDLLPVLFNISCDASVPFAELSTDGLSGQVMFDVYTTFRIMYVNRGKISIVKMKTADDEGKQMAREYKNNHQEENIQILLDELLVTEEASTTFVPSPSPVKTTPVEIR